MSRSNDFANFASDALAIPGRKNHVINGGFDIWQRGISFSGLSNGSVTADRWGASVSGAGQAMPSVARQSFTPGQTEVPGNPKYFSRFTFTGITVSTGAINCYSKIENVLTLAGKTVTLSFWAKSSVNNTVISPDVVQMFGTGGTPSNSVDNYTYVTLSTYWKKFTFTVSLPSMSGKTLGTNGDHSTTVLFWLSGGNGQGPALVPTQSGTVDIAQVQLEEGSFATEFERRHPGLELRLCQRYYEKSYTPTDAPGTVTTYAPLYLVRDQTTAAFGYTRPVGQPFNVRKRAAPTMTWFSPVTGAINTIRISVGGSQSDRSTSPLWFAQEVSDIAFGIWDASTVLTSLGDYATGHWTAQAEF